jgi:hypothetical protein
LLFTTAGGDAAAASHQPLAKINHGFANQRAAVYINAQLLKRTKQVEDKLIISCNHPATAEGRSGLKSCSAEHNSGNRN